MKLKFEFKHERDKSFSGAYGARRREYEEFFSKKISVPLKGTCRTDFMAIPKLGEVKYKVKRSSAGLGLFAEHPVKKGTWIIEYVGKIINGRKEVTDYPENKYLFETSAVRMIDGSDRSNIARYINHSCKSNCEPEIIGGRVFIKATRRIEVGEEFLYDYGKEYFDEYIGHRCRCTPCKTKAKK